MIFNKEKNKEIEYLEKINNERIRINEELNENLKKIIQNSEKLENYELWVNEKIEIFIKPKYIIKKICKNLEKEGFSKETVYVLIKNE